MYQINDFFAAMPRKKLFHWLGWFFAGNIVLFWLIGWHDIIGVTPLTFPVPNTLYAILVWTFLLLAYLGHFALLAFLPTIIVSFFIIIFPYRIIIQPLSILLATIAATLLIIDSIVFAHYHFHLNGVILDMFFSEDGSKIFDISWLEILLLLLASVFLLSIEIWWANKIWDYISQHKMTVSGKKFAISLITCLFISYLMFMLSNAQPVSILAQQSQAFPLYNNILATLLPIQNSFAKINSVGAGNYSQANQITGSLNYPLKPLVCHPSHKPLNILIIVIDAWRYDMLNPIDTPHLTAFAQGAWQYRNHWSGGNATRPGIFSLFYALPASYWTAMLQQQQSPVLMQALLQQHYQMGIFASAGLRYPDFQDTVFKAIGPQLITIKGNNVIERDQNTTLAFEHFLAQNPKPFFGFLFYDAAHTYCDDHIPALPFHPMLSICNRLSLSDTTDPVPYMNRYKNALFFLDQQINQVLTILQEKNLLNNTVIIITGDHGEEFNDNHLGYWGHAGNFTRYQVQTPLIIKWPRQAPKIIASQTTHYDIAPTLLQNVLYCENNSEDYSIGHSVFTTDTGPSPYVIVGSYIDLGVIEKDRITTIFPAGDYLITDLTDRQLPNAKLNLKLMQNIFAINRKYFRDH